MIFLPSTLTRPEIAPFAKGLGRAPEASGELLDRIFYWTHGHPYLTQKLCQAMVADDGIQTNSALDDLCSRLFLAPNAIEQDDNLLFVRERLLRSSVDRARLLGFYAEIRSGKEMAPDDSDSALNALRLSGITRVHEGAVRVRNRIYERVFDLSWVTRTALAVK